MTRSHILYWIWLSLCISPGSKYSDVLLEYFDESAQKIFEAAPSEYDKLKLPEDIKARLTQKSSDEARKILFWCRDHDVRLLAYDDPLFPERLRRIGKRPVLLYCRGREFDLNSELCVATVGTRRITSYGHRCAYTMSYDLCRAGAVVVSGLALGVDAVCHRGALDASGKTVAVLGCGIDVTYPMANFNLQLEIEKNGMVVSEYRPGTRPGRSTFPIRNRIISGLCQGTLVIEGDKASGAMITARSALSQGRDLFSLPGMVGEQNSEGTNALLREGAVPVTNAAELLQEYSLLYPDRIFIERIPIYKPEITVTPTPPSHRTGRNADAPKKNRKERAEEPSAEPTSDERRPENRPGEPLGESKTATDFPDIRKEIPQGLSETSAAVYRALADEEAPLSADQLTVRCSLPNSQVLTALTILEIKGHILSLPGGRFVLK